MARDKAPNHPRVHYLYGLHFKSRGQLPDALASYEKAIQNYSENDRFHLNEVWNNIGTVHYELSDILQAKGAWEKALMYLPSDRMTKANLNEFIYGNAALSPELRKPSPFVAKFL